MLGEHNNTGEFSITDTSSSPSVSVPFPKNSYIKNIEINDNDIAINFLSKKKIALLLVAVNERYWDYLKQCIEDCRKNFMPHHTVDYFVWSDMPPEKLPNVTLTETEPVQWPAPTLMRYHLFLQKEEELKDYDYIFYLDADMRVVDKISDDILGKGLTAAPHPGYAVMPLLIPPYEPNPDSTAFIPRLGHMVEEGEGKKRFYPFYAAGGFQGGVAKEFLKAMNVMRNNIDRDFNKNYVAIWNDESHWNRYLYDYQMKKGDITFLDPSYIYPDSLIDELYVPRIWGKKYPPKIITLTKPFTTSKQAGNELNDLLGRPKAELPTPFQCSKCGDTLEHPGHKINKVVECQGRGKPHLLDMNLL